MLFESRKERVIASHIKAAPGVPSSLADPSLK